MGKSVVVLGSFVADVSFRAPRLPRWGETLIGSAASLGPGGKGSNQAVAAARAGASAQLLTKVGQDSFAALGRTLWQKAGVDSSLVLVGDEPTGSAAILLEERSGENAIIVVPGASATVREEDVAACADSIRAAGVLLAQLEVPLPVVLAALRLARQAGVPTILNPAPAPTVALPEELLRLVDVLIPNESEAEQLADVEVRSPADAAVAAQVLQSRGASWVIVTLGAQGALVCGLNAEPVLIPSLQAGKCMETTGAGDAFCGAFAAKLAAGADPLASARFASAAAGLSVTRPGTAESMPHLEEIQAWLTSED